MDQPLTKMTTMILPLRPMKISGHHVALYDVPTKATPATPAETVATMEWRTSYWRHHLLRVRLGIANKFLRRVERPLHVLRAGAKSRKLHEIGLLQKHAEQLPMFGR